jgi:nitrile hydratase accessory protein
LKTPEAGERAGPQAEPVFAEPWQASAFALTVRLSEAGHFTWQEWTATLAAALAERAARDAAGDGAGYWAAWLAALERLATDKSLADAAALALRRDEWARAYRSTPHGQPVSLRPQPAAAIGYVAARR